MADDENSGSAGSGDAVGQRDRQRPAGRSARIREDAELHGGAGAGHERPVRDDEAGTAVGHRQGRERQRAEKDLARLSNKLNNAAFVDRAPADVVARERDKLQAELVKQHGVDNE